MKRILQKLLPAPLAIINWTMFLVGLGWAITFFVGETVEGLPPDSFDPFLIAVLYDYTTGEFTTFGEAAVDRLVVELLSATRVIGFNIKNFDYAVLRGYRADVDFRQLGAKRTLDMLEKIQQQWGFRVSLDSIAKATLGRGKSGQGVDASPFMPTPEEIARRTAQAHKLTLKELYRLIWRGTLPAIALNETAERDPFYSSYVQTYLQRDVRDLARVGDALAFLRFLRAAAARTGQINNQKISLNRMVGGQ